jgi:septal ring factor EnvC (AmiA/AmiB activator)
MSSEKTASAQMKERIDAARKELASAEAAIADIKAMPEMIEAPLKQSFDRSRELFARLEKVATTRAALADQIATDGATVVARSQESQKNISSLVQLLNALIAEGERVLGGLIKIRDVFVRR